MAWLWLTIGYWIVGGDVAWWWWAIVLIAAAYHRPARKGGE